MLSLTILVAASAVLLSVTVASAVTPSFDTTLAVQSDVTGSPHNFHITEPWVLTTAYPGAVGATAFPGWVYGGVFTGGVLLREFETTSLVNPLVTLYDQRSWDLYDGSTPGWEAYSFESSGTSGEHILRHYVNGTLSSDAPVPFSPPSKAGTLYWEFGPYWTASGLLNASSPATMTYEAKPDSVFLQMPTTAVTGLAAPVRVGIDAFDPTDFRLQVWEMTKSGWVYRSDAALGDDPEPTDSFYTTYDSALRLPRAGTWRVALFHAADAEDWEYLSPYHEVSVKQSASVSLALSTSKVSFNSRRVRLTSRLTFAGRSVPAKTLKIYRNGTVVKVLRTNKSGYVKWSFVAPGQATGWRVGFAGSGGMGAASSATKQTRPVYAFEQTSTGSMFEYPHLARGHEYRVYLDGHRVDLYSPSLRTAYHKYGGFDFKAKETGSWHLYATATDVGSDVTVSIW